VNEAFGEIGTKKNKRPSWVQMESGAPAVERSIDSPMVQRLGRRLLLGALFGTVAQFLFFYLGYAVLSDVEPPNKAASVSLLSISLALAIASVGAVSWFSLLRQTYMAWPVLGVACGVVLGWYYGINLLQAPHYLRAWLWEGLEFDVLLGRLLPIVLVTIFATRAPVLARSLAAFTLLAHAAGWLLPVGYALLNFPSFSQRAADAPGLAFLGAIGALLVAARLKYLGRERRRP
jgi:hypothetical protein